MNEQLRKIIKILLFLVFIGSIGMYAVQTYESYRAGIEYQEAEEIANVPDFIPEEEKEKTELIWREVAVYDDPYIESLEEIDIDSLREVNEDVIGWIVIPDTKLSYPVVKGADNEFYLNHTWKGVKSALGAIYMEQYNSPEFDDFHTIIYGHRMIDGTMFGSLKRYKTLDYFEEHPYVYVKDDHGKHRYEIFSAYEAAVDSNTYMVGKFKDENKRAFIKYTLEESVIDTGIKPEITDRILTLSTCTGKGYENRWVVHARLRGIEEEVPVN